MVNIEQVKNIGLTTAFVGIQACFGYWFGKIFTTHAATTSKVFALTSLVSVTILSIFKKDTDVYGDTKQYKQKTQYNKRLVIGTAILASTVLAGTLSKINVASGVIRPLLSVPTFLGSGIAAISVIQSF